MKVVIPFYSHLDSGKSPLYILMVRELRERYGIDIVAVTFGVHAKRYVAAHPEEKFAAIYDIYDFMSEHLDRARKLSYEELRALEDRYGMPNLGLYTVAAEPAFKRLDDDEARAVIVAQVWFWEHLFAREKPDAFMDEGVGGWMLPVYKVSQAYGCRILNLMTSRLPNRFVIHNNPFDHWERSEQIYAELKKRELTPEEKERAGEFIEKFQQRQLKPPYMAYTTKKPTLTLKAPLNLIKYARGVGEERRTTAFSTADSTTDMVGEVVRRKFRHFLHTALLKRWEDPVEGERYFLFPLQYQPENSTKVLTPFYLNQIALIENIARSLPAGTKLYVREHPSSIGTRPLGYYGQIIRVPSVRLITPYVDSYDLIRKSLAVITMTSTMGWESIIFRKPLVLFGSPYYHMYDHAIEVDDVRKLPAVLRETLDGQHWDAGLIDRMVLAVLGGTREGEINFELAYAFSKENVGCLCRGIAAELGLEP